MNKTFNRLLVATMLLASPFFLASCQDDDPDIKVLLPIAGDYHGTETGSTSFYDVHIYNTADRPTKMFVDNPYDIGERFEADVNGNTVTIAASEIEAPGIDNDTVYIAKFSASGTVTGDILKLNIKVEAVTGGEDNAYVGETTFTGDRAYRNPPVGNGG